MSPKRTSHLSPQDHSGQSEPPAGAPAQWRILVADDDPNIRQLLELALAEDGFEVISAADGYELVQLAQERAANLILVDLSMPRMDGYEAIRQLRHDTRTAHIPMLILTARSGVKDIVSGFETGADDYIAKPFDLNELLARVHSHLRRSIQRPVLNPLSGLPGNVLLSQELRHRLGRQRPIALLYTDLDNFKIFNDIYGFSRGDQVIQAVAQIVQKVTAAQGNLDDFVSHIGGDDFAILTTPDRIDRICHALIATFDQEIATFYNVEDRLRGYITSADRYGVLRRFGMMTISIGVVTNERRQFEDEEAFARVAAEMKRYAKERGGSTYAVDQRSKPHAAQPERRGRRKRMVLLASEDTSMRVVLRSTLQAAGYITSETTSAAGLRQMVQENRPTVVLADALLGGQLWNFCREQANQPSSTAVIVLAYEEALIEQARMAAADVALHLPLPLAEIVGWVDRLAKRETSHESSL